jgi:FtsH-binding integral membrane protein
MAAKNTSGSLVFLHVATAAYFILLGLVGIVNYNSDLSRLGRSLVQAFGGRNDVLGLIISILCLIAGIVLLVGLFAQIDSGIGRAAGITIFIFWALRIVYVYFRRDVFQPDVLVWLLQIAPDVVILAALWHISRKYS